MRVVNVRKRSGTVEVCIVKSIVEEIRISWIRHDFEEKTKEEKKKATVALVDGFVLER